MPDANVGQSELDYLASQFLISIPNVGLVGQFETCTEVTSSINVIKKRIGGSLLAKKIPGNIEVEPITITRGVLHSDKELFEKFKRTANLLDQRAIIDSNLIYERVDIIQTDRNANPLTRYRLFDVWASKYSSGKWDANADEVRMEELVLEVHRYEEDEDVSSIDLVQELQI